MIDSLRIHAAGEPAPRHGGGHVLYWMQSSFRARENHALDFAIEQANALRVPLVVYHGLRHDYPWANDRFHTFLLETAADLHGEFEALGIQYALYLEREGDDAAARRAAGRSSPLRHGAVHVTCGGGEEVRCRKGDPEVPAAKCGVTPGAQRMPTCPRTDSISLRES